MSEPENFLDRWSRRKATAGEEIDNAAPAETPDANARASGEEQEKAKEKNAAAPPPAQSERTEPEFDLSILPPIESIGAGTDVSVFLRSGVPAELTRAALRRAWTADPAIRDFIGLAENSWDFTAPGAIPGFGPLSAEHASRLMAQFSGAARQIVGEVQQTAEQISNLSPPAEPEAARSSSESSALRTSEKFADNSNNTQHAPLDEGTGATTAAAPSLQRDKEHQENIAPQNNPVGKDENAHPTRRAHGRALPK